MNINGFFDPAVTPLPTSGSWIARSTKIIPLLFGRILADKAIRFTNGDITAVWEPTDAELAEGDRSITADGDYITSNEIVRQLYYRVPVGVAVRVANSRIVAAWMSDDDDLAGLTEWDAANVTQLADGDYVAISEGMITNEYEFIKDEIYSFDGEITNVSADTVVINGESYEYLDNQWRRKDMSTSIEMFNLKAHSTQASAEAYGLGLKLGSTNSGAGLPLRDGTYYFNKTKQIWYMAMAGVDGGYIQWSKDPNEATWAENMASATGTSLEFASGTLNVRQSYLAQEFDAMFNKRRHVFLVDNVLADSTDVANASVGQTVVVRGSADLSNAAFAGLTKASIYEKTSEGYSAVATLLPGSLIGNSSQSDSEELWIYKTENSILGVFAVDDPHFELQNVDVRTLAALAPYSEADLTDLATRGWTTTQLEQLKTELRNENPPTLKVLVHPEHAAAGNRIESQYPYQKAELEYFDAAGNAIGIQTYRAGAELATRWIWMS